MNFYSRGASVRGRLAMAALAASIAFPLHARDLEARPRPTTDATPVASKLAVVDGQTYRFDKYLTKDGAAFSRVFDRTGREVASSDVPAASFVLVDPRLQDRLDESGRAGDVTRLVKVAVALRPAATRSADEPAHTGEAEVKLGEVRRVRLDGQDVEPGRADDSLAAISQVRQQANVEQLAARDVLVRSFARRHGLDGARGVEAALAAPGHTLTLELTVDQLNKLIASRDGDIAGIELHEEPQDTITAAMNDTNITNYALPYSSTRGNGIGIYMTESGCANESRISNYDRLSGSETNHSRNVGGIIRAVSPSSRLYCRGGAVLPSIFDLVGFPPFIQPLSPAIRVINRSNGGNDSTSYNTWDRDWDDFVFSWGIPAFVSAGNEGRSTDTGNVISPAKGFNIVSVGNYDDSNDSIWVSSSYVDPRTGIDKPEVSAPGRSINAGGFTMTGTSMSSPHAAAFTADMMSSSTYLKGRPHVVRAKLLAGATDSISGGSDKVGLGGVDFRSAHWSGQASWWEGNNASFSNFASSDGGTSSYYIEKRVYISSGWDNVRVVISWLNRGSYTYDHRNDAHAIGQDLDVRVYGPDGSYKGGSFSWDNSYETVNFTPTQSGYYTVKISRYANRDTGSNLRLGLYVNYYDD